MDTVELVKTLGLVLGPIAGAWLQSLQSAKGVEQQLQHEGSVYWRNQRVDLFADLMELGHESVYSSFAHHTFGEESVSDAEYKEVVDRFATLMSWARILAGGSDLRDATVEFFDETSRLSSPSVMSKVGEANWDEASIPFRLAREKLELALR